MLRTRDEAGRLNGGAKRNREPGEFVPESEEQESAAGVQPQPPRENLKPITQAGGGDTRKNMKERQHERRTHTGNTGS